MDWIRDPVWQFVGVILTAIALIPAMVSIKRKNKKSKKPDAAESGITIIIDNKGHFSAPPSGSNTTTETASTQDPTDSEKKREAQVKYEHSPSSTDLIGPPPGFLVDEKPRSDARAFDARYTQALLVRLLKHSRSGDQFKVGSGENTISQDECK